MTRHLFTLKIFIDGEYKNALIAAFKNKCRLTFPHVKSNLTPAHHKRWKRGRLCHYPNTPLKRFKNTMKLLYSFKI